MKFVLNADQHTCSESMFIPAYMFILYGCSMFIPTNSPTNMTIFVLNPFRIRSRMVLTMHEEDPGMAMAAKRVKFWGRVGFKVSSNLTSHILLEIFKLSNNV